MISAPMAMRKTQIEDHIATLEDFEAKYRAFLMERRSRAEKGQLWHGEDWTERKRELQELAPQAEAAMVAAGSTRWDEGPVRIDLPHRILNFVDPGDGVEDDEEQWKIVDELPTHIGALKGKLRHAAPDLSPAGSAERRGEEWAADVKRRARAVEAREAKEAEEAEHGRIWKLWHQPNPWVVGFGVTIIGGVIAGVILLILAA
jgi:hypothetical protein